MWVDVAVVVDTHLDAGRAQKKTSKNHNRNFWAGFLLIWNCEFGKGSESIAIKIKPHLLNISDSGGD